jgi:dipeptidase D
MLEKLKPETVWRHFEKLCAIPRPSRHEAAAARHVKELATTWGCEVIEDEVGNVIARKPATEGMEKRRGVVLQCHLDMVPQKNDSVKHDFEKDPIKPRIDGEVVRATGTTLGADNGIGVAAALAVLEAKDGAIPHGPLEVLFTIDEERGMTGAEGLKAGLLRGDILFNLDSEDEGEVCIGCAGGMDLIARLPYRQEPLPAGMTAFKISVGGLKGGHSGVDIQLGRGNANKILARLLWQVGRAMPLRLVSFDGGDLRNAIPRSATATFGVPGEQADELTTLVASMLGELRGELGAVDPDLKVAMDKVLTPASGMDEQSGQKLLNALYACPHGAFALIPGMPNVAETSTNLAIVKTEPGLVTIASMLRSSVDSRRPDVANTLRSVFELAGAEVEQKGGYPGWQPDFDSKVLALVKDVYKQKFEREMHVVATHGGLECGVIRSKYPKMEAVSFGPTIRFPHSPDEHVDIASVARFWELLVAVLASVPAAK